MPHLRYKSRPAAEQPQPRSKAPLSGTQSPSDLPAVPDVDILDLPLEEPHPANQEKPQVPFNAPRRREKKNKVSMLSKISMSDPGPSPADIEAHLLGLD